MPQNRPYEKSITGLVAPVAVLAVTVLMALIVGAFYLQSNAGNVAKQWVMHTYEVTGHIQLLFNRIKDVELGQRGYIITGQDSYLAAYNDAMKDSLGDDAKSDLLEQHHSIAEELAILEKLLQDNSTQEDNVTEMSNDVRELETYWAATIEAKHKNSAVPLTDEDFHQGNKLMDRVRSLVSIMMAKENHLLLERIENDRVNTARDNTLTYSSIATLYLIIVAAIWFYHRAKSRAQKELVHYMDELERNEETLRASMEHAPIGMALVGPDGKWLRSNQALAKIIGYSEAELVSKDFKSITHPDDLEKNTNYARSMLRKEIESYEMEKRYFHKDGHIVWVLLSVSLVWDSKNRPLYFIAQIQDISDRKQADRVRHELLEKLTESNTELERFAYVASHDMQEPLRMVANFGDLIRVEYGDKLDRTGQEYLDFVTDAAKRMQAMVVDLLEYARVGNDSTRFVVMNGDDELKHVVENLAATIKEQNASVTSDPLPEVKGNPVQFMRLLQNLIGNGLKYQPKGVQPKVHVHAEDEGGWWLFSVRDNGIGMREEYIHKIFEPFKRLHSWQEYQGTGIGLAVCKKIVENHAGKIWATSELGKGSVFYFTIPKNDSVISSTPSQTSESL